MGSARRTEDETVLKRTRRTETHSGVGVLVRAQVFSSIFRTPGTSVFVRVFQTLEVTITGSMRTNLFVPRTSVYARVFQTLEMTGVEAICLRQVQSSQGHPFSCAYFKHSSLPHFGSTNTSLFIPRTPVFVQIFQTLGLPLKAALSPTIPGHRGVFQTLEVTTTTLEQVYSCQGHSFSCAYFKRPTLTFCGSMTSIFIPRTWRISNIR